MKNKLFTFAIVAVTAFAIIYSFNNLDHSPYNFMAMTFPDHLPDPYGVQSDTLTTFLKTAVEAEQATQQDSETRLWIKVAFSGLFSLVALYVILSKRYEGENNDVRKWAYGVLALIAGVWIGTAT